MEVIAFSFYNYTLEMDGASSRDNWLQIKPNYSRLNILEVSLAHDPRCCLWGPLIEDADNIDGANYDSDSNDDSLDDEGTEWQDMINR